MDFFSECFIGIKYIKVKRTNYWAQSPVPKEKKERDKQLY
jgi:hypothetical protein